MDEIKLGDVTVTRIEEMHGPLSMTPQELIPGVPEQVWQRHAAERTGWVRDRRLGTIQPVLNE